MFQSTSLELQMRSALELKNQFESCRSPSPKQKCFSPRSPISPSSSPARKKVNSPSKISSQATLYVSDSRQDLAMGFKWLWQSRQFFDACIKVENVVIECHAVVLAACSKPFKSMLSGGYCESGEKCIEISGYSQQVVRKMVEFIYTGDIEITNTDVIDLFLLSDQFCINELKRICEEHVSSTISMNSVIPLMISAKNHVADQLLENCFNFFKKDAFAILSLPEVIEIPEDLMIDLLMLDFDADELKIFQCVLSWARGRIEKLKNSSLIRPPATLESMLTRVIRYIRFASIRRDQIEKVVIPLKILPDEIIVDVLHDRKADFSSSGGLTKLESIDFVQKPWMKTRGKLYKRFSDFPNEDEYGEYMKKTLRPGMILKAVRSYESVQEGDMGSFLQHNAGVPPCQVAWRGHGNAYWLHWRDLEIVEE